MADKKLTPSASAQKAPKERDHSGQIRRKRIGDKLRQLYDDVANEPVPDDFLKLLRDADAKPKPEEKN